MPSASARGRISAHAPGKVQNIVQSRYKLSSSGTLESKPESAEPQQEHDHAQAAPDHQPGHSHGPVLNPDCTREVVIDVPADEVAAAFRKVAANYRRYAKIPGFRAGKVPESIVRRRFAAEIRKEVIDSLLPERFNKAVSDLSIRLVGQRHSCKWNEVNRFWKQRIRRCSE